MAKNLVIYYSRRGQNFFGGQIVSLEKGNSEIVAEYIDKAVGADLFEIETVYDYPEDYTECTEVAKAEIRENARPELTGYLRDLDSYENIFIVGPCWWGTYPMAMYSQLERLDFRGKKVLPVMTHEGSGMGSSERDLKRMCKGARFVRGLAIHGTAVQSSEETVAKWAAKHTK